MPTLADRLASLTSRIGAEFKTTRAEARAQMFAFVPPAVGWFSLGPGFLGPAVSAPVVNRVTFTPFFVGPAPWSTDAFNVNVTTAAVGGSGLKLSLGIYADDGSGFPLTVGGPLRSVDITTFTIGLRLATFTALALKPGLYWLASNYTYATAPSTAPQVTCITNSAWQLSNPLGASQSGVRGYTVTGTALPTTVMSGFSISGSNDCPLIAVRRST